ncbi:hypothetical protein ACJIZ3_015473 [Penstemon smallii]|uniref:Uncharacterized protein n=1 Tax=Penstemon smallii TaxID=265156 RepID=A0ABD3RMK9_9LAMI
MDIAIITPSPKDINFESTCTTPYISASSSPNHHHHTFFYSAPTSPTRVSAFFHGGDTLSKVPFDWEDKPGTPKTHISTTTATSSNYGDVDEDLEEEIDFEFNFSGQLEKGSLPADELFDGGKIKPLKPPPRFDYDLNIKPTGAPKSPKKLIKEAFSPRQRKRDFDFDPFAVALEQTQKENEIDKRGREKINHSSRIKGSSRSLSPYRVSDLLIDPEFNEPTKNSNSSLPFSSFWYKKWKIKDLLLFRSASESRASDEEEQLKKYELLKKARQENVRNLSFRSSTENNVGSAASSSRRISAHEMHYTINRAASEEMKKRTYLPYKRGLLGCLGFQPTVHDISKGFASSGSVSRG